MPTGGTREAVFVPGTAIELLPVAAPVERVPRRDMAANKNCKCEQACTNQSERMWERAGWARVEESVADEK